MNRSTQVTSSFLFLCIVGCFCTSRKFKVTWPSNNTVYEAKVGNLQNLETPHHLMTCLSNENFDYCIWRHENRVCTMEYNSSHCFYDHCYHSKCTGPQSEAFSITSGMKIVEDGETNSMKSIECTIVWGANGRGIQLTDAGDWSCEMGRYDIIPFHKISDVRHFSLNVTS